MKATLSVSGERRLRIYSLLAVGRMAALCLLLIEPSRGETTASTAHFQTESKQPIAWNEIGAKTTSDYHGEGLAVRRTGGGAWLRCAFQRLEAEATTEGLWLRSSMSNQPPDRFRIVARALTRVPGGEQRPAALILPVRGTVSVPDQLARFTRPGLIEEYSVSVDGVRQDFLVRDKPKGAGALRLELNVSGAAVEPLGKGARLVLDGSGRKIAYNRLRVTDATGKELAARIDVETSQMDASLTVIVEDAQALYPVRVDPTFSDENWISMGGIPGTDGSVLAAVVDGSGDLYIGGSFRKAGGVVVNNIAKWSGSSWSALGSGMDFEVSALAVSGSNVYAGGRFTTAGDVAANYIAKWNGSSWSALGSGMGGGAGFFPTPSVSALAVSGSDVYAGGGFTTAGGSAANFVAKWNGSNWSALGLGVEGGSIFVPPHVYALVVSGTDVYAGGYFTIAGGTGANCIAKWDGSNWSALGSGVNSTVYALTLSGSDLFAGGGFAMAGGVAANRIARWDGSNWSALSSGLDFYVYAIVASAGDVYAGGPFSTAGGSAARGIAKWNGSNWSALNSGTDAEVDALAAWGTDVYVGGAFRTTGGVAANGVAKWNGSSWSAFGLGLNNSVNALAVSETDIYAGGVFETAGGTVANHIAKWNGNTWSALGKGLNDIVRALAVSGNDLYAAGSFTTAMNSGGDVISANQIAKWNGSSWSALSSGMSGFGPDTTVFALAISGSNVYAGGRFSAAGGSAANHIAKWNGSSWSGLGSGMDTSVYALTVSGSDLFAGGLFATAGGIAANYVAKWNGSSWSALGSGMNSAVSALVVLGGDLYAGGYFTTAGGTDANYIAKWNGSSWSGLGSGMGDQFPFVSALAVSGSDVYVAGDFTTAGGTAASYIAKWDGSSWSALGSGMNDRVQALAVSGANLYVGGYFTTAGGKVSAYAARAIIEGDAPYVTGNPANQTVSAGCQVQFCVAATGNSPLRYKWWFNSQELSDAGRISGVASNCITISDVQAQDAGDYYAIVTNASGSVTSSVAVLTVETAGAIRWDWTRRVASTINQNSELAIGLAIDSAANLYITGWFDGMNDFGGVALTSSPGGGQEMFVAKYNSSGALMWARQAGSSNAVWDAGRSIKVDGAGNVYVTGQFVGTANFGPTNVSSASMQFFLAKYDNAGALQWVRPSTGLGTAYGTGLAVDSAGNSYAVGYIDSSLTLSFGGNTSVTNTNATGYSTFLVKYDASGNAQWAKLISSPQQSYSTSVALDGSGGSVFVSGAFDGSLFIGNTNLMTAGVEDGFLAKFNGAGNLQWVRQMRASSYGGDPSAVVADASGTVYVAGGFGSNAGDTICFSPSICLTNIGGGFPDVGVGDAFLVKYDGISGTPQWAVRNGGTNADAYFGVSTDAEGNVYAGGGFDGTGLPDGFKAVVTKYSTNGVLQWTELSRGDNGALIWAGPLVDAMGNCYAAGWFSKRASFGCEALTGSGYWDIFLAKLNFAQSAPVFLSIQGLGTKVRLSWPNPIFSLQAAPSVSGVYTNIFDATSPYTNDISGVQKFYRLISN